MILCDIDIHTLARRELVTPFDPELVNPASLDVRLGENLLMEQEEHPALLPYSIAGATQEKPFLLYPQQFVLAETLEEFKLPDCIAGQLALKSVVPGKGLSISLLDISTPDTVGG